MISITEVEKLRHGKTETRVDNDTKEAKTQTVQSSCLTACQHLKQERTSISRRNHRINTAKTRSHFWQALGYSAEIQVLQDNCDSVKTVQQYSRRTGWLLQASSLAGFWLTTPSVKCPTQLTSGSVHWLTAGTCIPQVTTGEFPSHSFARCL